MLIMISTDKFNNSVVILTGATSGIGKELAKMLATTNAKLVLHGRSLEKLDQLLEEIPSKDNIEIACFDLTEIDKIKGFISGVQSKYSKVTHLINCAGLNSARGTVDEISLSDLDYMMDVNFRAPFCLMQEAYKQMKKDNKGLIINVLSTVCLFANEGIGAYTASKSALDAMTKVLRKEARNHNVKVTSVYPGGVNTAFRAADRPEYLSAESVALSIFNLMLMPDDLITHELVIRPMVEENFA